MNPLQSMTGFTSLMNPMQSFSPAGAMGGFSQLGAMGGVGAGLNININLGTPLDKTSFSQFGQDPFNGGFSNPFGNNAMNGLSSLGMGNVPGFGGALNPAGSMFGGLMQQMQSQQQMMMMMMMMLMMMMQQKQNGFGGQQGAELPGIAGGTSGMGGGIPGMGGGIPGFSGGGGSAAPAAGGGSAAPVNIGSVGQGGQAAVDLAKKFLGRDSISCKGQLPHFQAAGGVTNNCADFVWSCLEATGRVSGKHQINVGRMEEALKQQGWRQVSQAQARPGDVWMNASRGHVELVSEAGGRKLIGSNGSARQRITENTPYTAGVFYTKD